MEVEEEAGNDGATRIVDIDAEGRPQSDLPSPSKYASSKNDDEYHRKRMKPTFRRR